MVAAPAARTGQYEYNEMMQQQVNRAASGPVSLHTAVHTYSIKICGSSRSLQQDVLHAHCTCESDQQVRASRLAGLQQKPPASFLFTFPFCLCTSGVPVLVPHIDMPPSSKPVRPQAYVHADTLGNVAPTVVAIMTRPSSTVRPSSALTILHGCGWQEQCESAPVLAISDHGLQLCQLACYTHVLSG